MAQVRKFDTQVQYLKYKVLREVARRAFHGNLMETISEIPKVIVPCLLYTSPYHNHDFSLADTGGYAVECLYLSIFIVFF